MTLHDSIAYFTRETRIMPGLSVACGTAEHAVTAQGGYAVEKENIRGKTGEEICRMPSSTWPA